MIVSNVPTLPTVPGPPAWPDGRHTGTRWAW